MRMFFFRVVNFGGTVLLFDVLREGRAKNWAGVCCYARAIIVCYFTLKISLFANYKII